MAMRLCTYSYAPIPMRLFLCAYAYAPMLWLCHSLCYGHMAMPMPSYGNYMAVMPMDMAMPKAMPMPWLCLCPGYAYALAMPMPWLCLCPGYAYALAMPMAMPMPKPRLCLCPGLDQEPVSRSPCALLKLDFLTNACIFCMH